MSDTSNKQTTQESFDKTKSINQEIRKPPTYKIQTPPPKPPKK